MNQTIPTVILNDGVEVPVIGFGTGQIKGEAAVSSVSSALSIGYRLLDTAFNYENEGAVGAGIRASGVPREHIVVTSKLPVATMHTRTPWRQLKSRSIEWAFRIATSTLFIGQIRSVIFMSKPGRL